MRITRLLWNKATATATAKAKAAGPSWTIDQAMAGRNGLNSMQGLTVKSLNRHYALWPLFVIMGAGCVFVGAYLVRLGTKTTDIQWTRNPDMNECYKDKNFRILNIGPLDMSHSTDRIRRGSVPQKTTPLDHSKFMEGRPDYRK